MSLVLLILLNEIRSFGSIFFFIKTMYYGLIPLLSLFD
nr:MAG TPA: hypothetical protein [Caudoviricetes sp.]